MYLLIVKGKGKGRVRSFCLEFHLIRIAASVSSFALSGYRRFALSNTISLKRRESAIVRQLLQNIESILLLLNTEACRKKVSSTIIESTLLTGYFF